MSIIAGYLKGREFKAPHGHKTHPMSDKVRGALFNVLGDIEGLSFLDAFAGSGALAFEAASRGAQAVTAIDKDSSAHKALEENIKELKLNKIVHASKANTAGWSIHNMERRFDIVILDPPYEELQTSLLEKLVKRHVKKNGLAVLSYPGHTKPPEFDDAAIVAEKNYGDAQLVFYRKTK
jgi:16S rRNA (guanine966-N2)-methyltransferase